MEKSIRKVRSLLTFICLGVGFFTTRTVMAEGSPIYYYSFYEDYYKAYPNKRPVQKQNITYNNKNTAIYDPYMQYQTNATYTQNISPYNSFYQTSVEHPLKRWDLDIQLKRNLAHFMFRSDVGSILNWDELHTHETLFKASRDFMYKNRQYVFSATYGTGSGTTKRTSDDDIFNEAHIISLGSGDVGLSTYAASLGVRNLWKLGNWDVTPYIGYKQKKTNFTMFDHATPFTFQLEYFCENDGNGGCADIDLLTHVNDTSYWQSTMYYAEETEDGDIIKKPGTVNTADMIIPGDQIGYGDQIYQEDFCFDSYTYEEDGVTPKKVCISADNEGEALLYAFGGVSSVNIANGVTHMYFVTWSGPFVGLNFERKISSKEDLSFYMEYFIPHYKVWGNWPNRTDWAHDPSFYDEGGSGMGYLFDLSYKYNIYKNVMFTTTLNYEYLENKNATTTLYLADGEVAVLPNAILVSKWKSYGLALGLSFRF